MQSSTYIHMYHPQGRLFSLDAALLQNLVQELCRLEPKDRSFGRIPRGSKVPKGATVSIMASIYIYVVIYIHIYIKRMDIGLDIGLYYSFNIWSYNILGIGVHERYGL